MRPTIIELSPETLKALQSIRQPIGPTSLDWPAWVQAIGSVVAILVAVSLWARDTRQRYRDELRKQGTFAQYAYMVSLEMRVAVVKLRELSEEGVADAVLAVLQYLEAFESICQQVVVNSYSLSIIPASDWPDIRMCSSFSMSRLAFEQAGRAAAIAKKHVVFVSQSQELTDSDYVEIILSLVVELDERTAPHFGIIQATRENLWQTLQKHKIEIQLEGRDDVPNPIWNASEFDRVLAEMALIDPDLESKSSFMDRYTGNTSPTAQARYSVNFDIH